MFLFVTQSLHRSESMVSLACFRTLSQLTNSDNTNELQQYLASNKNVIIDDRDEVCRFLVNIFEDVFNSLRDI